LADLQTIAADQTNSYIWQNTAADHTNYALYLADLQTIAADHSTGNVAF